MKPDSKQPRITRSITLPSDLYQHVKKRAQELDRSVNWVLNAMVAKEIKSATK